MNLPPVRKRWQIVNGVLLLDKPQGLSSNDALQKARRLFSAAKAGHTGTLDPMATGLLPLCFGEATKFSNRLLDADKTYRATMLLGIRTSTGDAEGEELERREVSCDSQSVLEACSAFVGDIEQLPPMYSALKFQGRALYEYAREGVEIERQKRQVRIYSLEVVRLALPEVEFVVRCSKGTYIRTLAEDIGARLGCGAHLVALRRTGIGPLDVENALTLEQITAVEEGARQPLLASPDTLLSHLPAMMLDGDARTRILLGQAVRAPAGGEGEVRLYGPDFLGLGVVVDQDRIQPVRLIRAE